MVGGFVQDQDVGPADHHPGEKTADLFPSGEHPHLFHPVLTGKEHPAQKAPYIGHILDLRVLGEPLGDVEVVVKLLRIVLGEVSPGGGDAPLVVALIRFHLSHEDLEEGGDGQFVGSHKGHLVVVAQGEGEVIQHLDTVDGLGQVFHGEDLVSDLPVGTEIDVGIFPAGGTDLFQLYLFQGSLSGSGLSGLGGVGAETGDKLLQFLDLFLFFLVGFLHLADQQLAGFKPEVVVSGVELDLAVVNVRRMGTDLV